MVDRTTDWNEFFDKYTDIAKPRIINENNDADIPNRSIINYFIFFFKLMQFFY